MLSLICFLHINRDTVFWYFLSLIDGSLFNACLKHLCSQPLYTLLWCFSLSSDSHCTADSSQFTSFQSIRLLLKSNLLNSLRWWRVLCCCGLISIIVCTSLRLSEYSVYEVVVPHTKSTLFVKTKSFVFFQVDLAIY